MESLGWIVKRLSVMGPLEVIYRLRKATQSRLELCGFGKARVTRPDNRAGAGFLKQPRSELNVMQYCTAAERILAGHFDVFAMSNALLTFPPEWNRDPKTGILGTKTFGKTLNYRDEQLVGDIKYLWEPNRHLELVSLAQAWSVSRKPHYAEGCRVLLLSWFEQCPYPLGPNWVSSLEHSVRLVNWACAWQLLDEDGSPIFDEPAGVSFRNRWLDSIYQHCHFICGHLSKYSSANNHLLGEYMGLFIAAVTWPKWKESAKWLELSKEGLERQVLLQNASDGVNREQGIWYHHEVADMMILCLLAGQNNDVEFSQAFFERLKKMLEFIASVMDSSGNIPMIGDSDDAVMVRLSPREVSVYRSLLATGAVLFERGDFKSKARAFDSKSHWLLGDDGLAKFESLKPVKHIPTREFAESGYWLLGDDFDSKGEVRLLADAGPLGYLSIAAHGHADALALHLSVAGQEMLVDPGTYAYHTQQVWRNYFRGTSAHNTLRVDSLDQSVIGGNFMWLRHASAQCLNWESNAKFDHWSASHDGYERLSDPVIHQRDVTFDKLTRVIHVTDKIECDAEHEIEIFWHFAEDCSARLVDGGAYATKGNVRLTLQCPEGLSLRLVHGEESPPLGWVSRSFDVKVPAYTLVASRTVRGDWCGTTNIRIEIDD